jgi:hypothetical protein
MLGIAAGVLLGTGLGVLGALGVGGCEEQAAPAPKNSSGNTIGLSETPNSLYGRSAKRGKDVAAQIENKQAETVGVAEEMSGEASALEVGGVVWSVPTSWQKVTPGNQMRQAEYHVKGEDGGEAVAAWSSGIKGTEQQNIDRWAGLMSGEAEAALPMVKHRKVAGMNVALVEMEGTYKDPMAGVNEPRPGQLFRGAIIDGPNGTIFIKMVGPKAVMDAAADQWTMMIDGMHGKGR